MGTTELPFRIPKLREKDAYALNDLCCGIFRLHCGKLYITATQHRLVHESMADFEDWQAYITECAKRPENQVFRWIMLRNRPENWNSEVYSEWPQNGKMGYIEFYFE